jgi:hypothetical protein
MKKLICLMLTAAMVLTPTTMAFAKNGNQGHQNQQSGQQVEEQNNDQDQDQQQEQQSVRIKEKKQSFKLDGSPVIKYGKYKIPLSPISKGMGATTTYDKATAVLTIKKDTTTIVIDFKNKTVTVNGIADTTSGIFTAKNDKKMTVLVKYIAKVLGVRVSVDKDKVVVTVPGLDYPANVTVTPVGGTVVANALNNTNLALTAAATIKAGQATKAELYVGTKLVATDATIAATDTVVTFTTADDTPINTELQTAVPTGGVVTVRLYNASNVYVISKTANPTLIVDYVAPTVATVISAAYSVSGSAITVTLTGASAVGDKVDVTKVSFYDSALARTYQLTNTTSTGSTGVVVDANTLIITLGSADRIGLTGFGLSSMFMNIAAGSLLSDATGNVSIAGAALAVPVVVSR